MLFAWACPAASGEHLGLGVHADGLSDVLCERECQLAGAAAQVEQAPGAVEVELPGEVVDERLWIAWPISRVVPGGSCERVAVWTVVGVESFRHANVPVTQPF
jgi:hypothetical protein